MLLFESFACLIFGARVSLLALLKVNGVQLSNFLFLHFNEASLLIYQSLLLRLHELALSFVLFLSVLNLPLMDLLLAFNIFAEVFFLLVHLFAELLNLVLEDLLLIHSLKVLLLLLVAEHSRA